jgi:hypothetical protein
MSAEEIMFALVVNARLDEAERITGHRFIKLRDLIRLMGAAEAVRFLLSPERPGGFTEGFEVLARYSLLSHSIEQAAIEFAEKGLFTEMQLSKARAQLAIAKMIWPHAR